MCYTIRSIIFNRSTYKVHHRIFVKTAKIDCWETFYKTDYQSETQVDDTIMERFSLILEVNSASILIVRLVSVGGVGIRGNKWTLNRIFILKSFVSLQRVDETLVWVVIENWEGQGKYWKTDWVLMCIFREIYFLTYL